MPNLVSGSRLREIQEYVRELEKERDFIGENVLQKCLMLGEEVGELFKAVRKHEKLKIDPCSENFHIYEELADILIFLCSIANRFDVDLEEALRAKEEINKKRLWKIDTVPSLKVSSGM